MLLFVLMIAVIASGLTEQVVSDQEADEAVRFRYSVWAVATVVAFTAFVLRVWWHYRSVRYIKGHFLLFVLGVVVPIVFLSRQINDNVVVDDTHFEWNTLEDDGCLRFADVQEMGYQTHSPVLGSPTVSRLRVTLKSERGAHPELGSSLARVAGPEILQRAEQAGVLIRQGRPQK